MRRAARTALFVWAAITLLVAASLFWIYLRLGVAGFSEYIQTPPLIILPVTLASVGLMWLSIGALLALLWTNRIQRSNIVSVGGFFTILWVYLNILSERVRYGDYGYYFDAATRLHNGQPLPSTYFYLPFWATVTQFIAPLGDQGFFLVLWFLNILSLLLFYFLLHRTLQRYGFSVGLAAIATTLFILVNVPLLRTLAYVQVNLHTLNLILLSLLLYPKKRFLSALALALAVHLKTSPAVLVLAVLLEKDWRWLLWLAINLTLIAAVTIVLNGAAPFVEAFHNMLSLAASQNMIFHETSFDSFLRVAGHILHLSATAIRVLIYVAKGLLLIGTLAVMRRCVRLGAFLHEDQPGERVLNALPALFILMTLASPIVWEHHGVFVALSFLLLLKRIDQPADWTWFASAYLLEFLLPTFDFFPWSYGRLLAPLIILWLMWKTSHGTEASPSFRKLDLMAQGLAGY